MQKYLFSFLCLLGFFSVYPVLSPAQTLNLPPRNATALNGDQFVSLVTAMSLTDRENEIYSQVMSGNVPAFQRALAAITHTESVSGTSYTCTYYVLPDYLAIGHDTNYFLCPMTPLLAQRIANATGCTLPTRKMVDGIWAAAPLHLSPSTISPSPQMTTIPVMAQHNTTVWGQRSAVLGTYPLGTLVGGDKKDVVISNIIYGYPAPGRVVIYGWHYTNGTPIQPLYNGHEETYADYSHGIRLVQNSMLLNGNVTTVTATLQSSALYSLLSDEGVIATPYYPYTTPAVATPVSFAVVNENAGNLRIVTTLQTDVTHYLVQTSADGTVFNPPVQYHRDSLLLTGLNPNQPVFLKMAAKTAYNTSAYSEVLGGVPSACKAPVLIVNAFDRATTGNTFDFIRQHGKAFFANGFGFVSCTNEALVNGLVVAGDYRIMDVILGEESTANETFSAQEQLITTDYLKQGGCLFVSGAETAWDLDHLGSAADKDFYNNYLKAAYVNDAPNGQNGVYYTAQPATNSIFTGMGTMSFDNGTQGTYNVIYPDVLSPLNGAVGCLEYSSLTAQYAGVSFSGLFPQGSEPAKLVNLGIPFETFYPESTRNSIIGEVLTFFNVAPSGFDTPVITLVNDTLFSDWSGLQQWYLNGMPLSGATGSFYKPLQNGDYYVIAGEGNCYSGLSNILTVVISDADNSVGLPFSFAAYPNPFDDVLNIVFPENGLSKQILIYDVYGKLVFSSSSTLTHESIYMGALANGLYFLEIYIGNEMPEVRRIVKQ